MSGTDVAADVPLRYDLVIDGYGYMQARAVDPNLPFRTQQQALSYTPTFLERTNVSGAYSDNQQDFFLTVSQKDWSGGEDQHFFRGADVDSARRYWLGSNVDITVPGQASLRPATTTVSFAASVTNAVGMIGGSLYTASSTNLYEINRTGTITDRGAHGAGALPDAFCTDGVYVYMTGISCTKIRKYDTSAHTFADFSATPADSICFLNNTLYGTASGNLYAYSTAGATTTIFTWKDAVGAAIAGVNGRKKIIPFGGKIMVLAPALTSAAGPELWIADNTGAQRVAELPTTFLESGLVQANGIVFVAGQEDNANFGTRTVIYYYANGTLDRLWQSQNWFSGNYNGVAIAKYQRGVVFTDLANQAIRYYDLATGATSVIAPFVSTTSAPFIAGNNSATIVMQASANTTFFSYGAGAATSGFVETSLIDFDNSLTKLFRGIKIDFNAATNGDGGSFDIAYRVNDVEGSYTTLQTGAVSGTEYALTGVSGRSITVKVTLNKGTSTYGPTLKRIYVRGVGVLQAYRLNSFILDLGGGYQNPVRRRDDSDHILTGEEMRANLAASITTQAPISITDITGTYTGVLEPSQCEFDTNRPSQYYARIQIREV